MKRPVVPFLTPPETALSHGGWLLRLPDGDVEMPREVPHWDYQTTLEFVAPVSVDRVAVTSSCDLDWSTGLAVMVMARSDRTSVETVAARLELPMADDFDLAVEVRLAGDLLGGRLTLETLLVVSDPKPLGTLAPQHKGSILWRTSHWTDLEGVGTQFPTDTLDFSAAGFDPSAGWLFKVDLTDPEARFMAAARLTLNSGNPAILKMLSGAKDAGTGQLLKTLNWDITRQMALAALNSQDVLELEMDPDATSVAGVLRNLLARIWPGVAPTTLHQWMVNDPSRIEARIQHSAKLVD